MTPAPMDRSGGLDWPGILADIAEAAGPMAALRVAEARGGLLTYFPRASRLRDDHWLVMACGWDAARAIARRVGGSREDVPLGPCESRAAMRRAIRQGLADGLPGQEIARRVGVTSRTVRRVKNGRSQQEQYQLF
ncbi:MAG: hypothetical protein AB7U59_13805 [Desulfovibrionaceae bacterium]